jgi:hypothetical protein
LAVNFGVEPDVVGCAEVIDVWRWFTESCEGFILLPGCRYGVLSISLLDSAKDLGLSFYLHLVFSCLAPVLFTCSCCFYMSKFWLCLFADSRIFLVGS